MENQREGANGFGKQCLSRWSTNYMLDREEKEYRGKFTYGWRVDW